MDFREAVRRDTWDGSDLPEGALAQCELRRAAVPDPGSKKGGVAPVHLRFPRAGAAVRGSGRNHKQEREIGEFACVRGKALMM